MIQELIQVICFSTVFAPVCIAIHVIMCWKGNFGYGVGNLLQARLPDWIAKPLFTCPTCMASIWGTIFWFVIGGSFPGWWVVACFALCGVNTVASALLYNCQEKDEL